MSRTPTSKRLDRCAGSQVMDIVYSGAQKHSGLEPAGYLVEQGDHHVDTGRDTGDICSRYVQQEPGCQRVVLALNANENKNNRLSSGTIHHLRPTLDRARGGILKDSRRPRL